MSDYRKLSDEELADRLKTSDRQAYTEIYERFWPLLFRHARRMLRNDEDATDVVQDIFTMLWSKGPSLALHSSLSSFLYTATRHKVLNHIKHHQQESNYLHSLSQFMEQGAYITDQAVLASELSRRIEREVARLPKKMQQIFLLSRQQNLSYKQIAEELQTSEGNVKKQVFNALKLLRARLNLVILGFLFQLLAFFYRIF